MNTIYHYTDLNGFLGIIQSKQLWLSAANNLNDYSEVSWSRRIIHNQLNEMANDDNLEIIDKLWTQLSISRNVPYICSFSKAGDLLTQWRAYANDARGVAIGFNREAFIFKQGLPTMGTTSEMATGISEVVYDEVVQRKNIEEVLQKFLESVSSRDVDESAVVTESAILKGYSYVFKNPAFKEEEEVRIIHTPLVLENDEGEITLSGNISDLKYRVSGERMTSYFEIDFSDVLECKNPINEVYIGPKLSVDDYDIKTFLSLNGFGGIPFHRSTATYR